jgi:hypothetical protein
METSFNEEVSLQAASDTCRYTNGWGVRGVVSSAFWRFFEFVRFLVGFLYRFAFGVFFIYKNFGASVWDFLSAFPVSFLSIFSFLNSCFVISALVHSGFVESIV